MKTKLLKKIRSEYEIRYSYMFNRWKVYKKNSTNQYSILECHISHLLASSLAVKVLSKKQSEKLIKSHMNKTIYKLTFFNFNLKIK